jgi:hypothetical protein
MGSLKFGSVKRWDSGRMDQRKLRVAQNALRKLAMREGKPVAEIRKEIREAIFVGLCNPDPKIQAYWKQIAHNGDVPTPEEVIAFLADEARQKS